MTKIINLELPPITEIIDLKGADMHNLTLSLSLAAQVVISGGGGSAIAAAVAASTSDALFIDTSSSALLGGVSDGGAVSTITLAEDNNGNITPENISGTWDETRGLIQNPRIQLTDGGRNWPTNGDFYMVIETTDTSWFTFGCSTNGSQAQAYANSAQTAVPNLSFGATGLLYVNGVLVDPNQRDTLQADAAVGSKVVLSGRGVGLNGFNSAADLRLFSGDNTGDAQRGMTGYGGDIVIVDAQGDTEHAAIVAELAARHSITL